MRSQIFLFAFILGSMILSGCGGPPAPTPNATNTVNSNTNSPVETIKKTPEPTVNEAPTLTPVVKAYCDAWVKKDEAALRKVYSAETLKEFDAEMKAEKIKSLLKFLEDDKVSGAPCVARNEQITGDKAVAEVGTDRYPRGMKIVFVKENGEWKITTKSPDFDSVRTNTNVASNTAK